MTAGCPILEGEKWITTLWMRQAVNATDPFDTFYMQGGKVAPEHQHMYQCGGKQPTQCGGGGQAATGPDFSQTWMAYGNP